MHHWAFLAINVHLILQEKAKPFVRVGRKASGLKIRQPGCLGYMAIRLFYFQAVKRERQIKIQQ
jgi:hypothetical protein